MSTTQTNMESPSCLLDNKTLMDYATYTMANCRTPVLVSAHNDIASYATNRLGNSCIAPVTALRGWGLLSLMAAGKTREEISHSTAKILGCKKDSLHRVLNSVDSRLTGVTLYFADYTKESVLEEEVITTAASYSTLHGQSPLRQLCFGCDMNSLRTMYHINRAVREATTDRVQYVVREEHAPNRGAMAVLVSAVDCTFFWKHERAAVMRRKTFHGDGVRTTVNGWLVTGNFYYKRDPKGLVLRLDSHQPNLHLILYTPTTIVQAGPSAMEILEAEKSIVPPLAETRLFVPQFSVATPLSLRDSSREGPFNMKRVFDREKSDLTGYLQKFHNFCPRITTLWDHYHKAVFKIVDGAEERPVPKKEPRLQTRFTEASRGFIEKTDLREQTFKYREDHLSDPVTLSGQQAEKEDEVTADVNFDEPFFFLLVQDIHDQPLIHCFGRFTNSEAVNVNPTERSKIAKPQQLIYSFPYRSVCARSKVGGATSMNFTRIRRLIQYLVLLYVLALTDLWCTLSRIWRRDQLRFILDERPIDKLKSPLKFVKPVLAAVVKSPAAKMKKMFAPQGIPLFADGVEEGRSESIDEGNDDFDQLLNDAVGPTTSDWAAGPRDETTLPRILTAMHSKNKNEADYALNEMVKIIEKIDMESHSMLVCAAFENFLTVSARKDLTDHKYSNILNHLPFLYSCSTSSDAFASHGKRMLEFLIQCLHGRDQPRRSAIYATTALLERDSITEDELQETIIPTLFKLLLSHEVVEEHRNELATTICRIAQSRLDSRWIFEHFIPKFSLLLRDQHVHVKKAAISILGHLSQEFGGKFTEEFVVPHVVALIGDNNWSVRKIVSEIIVQVSQNCPSETRKNFLAPRFSNLLKDSNRWVAFQAFQELGPFITTFADSSITGLNINEAGQVVSDEHVRTEQRSDFEFDELPEGVYVPSEAHNRYRPFSQEEADTVLGEMTNMLDNWDQNDFCPSFSGSTSAAAKCSSVEDLSNLDFDDDDHDQSFFDLEEDNMEGTEEEQKESVNSGFGPGYWSAGHDIVDISDDLIAFGAASSDTSTIQHLTLAMEKAKVTTSETDSAGTFSERLSDSLSFKSESDDMDNDDPIRDCRGSDEDVEKMDTSDMDEYNTSKAEMMNHVPRDLVDNFLAMVSPSVQSDPDINRYCAHNFPAVAYTLGRDSWPILREAYKRLASEDLRVRMTIASSLHEIARIVGRDWADTDLLPIFNQYRDDAPEVRYNILKNLFEFFQCLSEEKRVSMIDVLPQMLPLSTNSLRNDWRHRHEFAIQCRKLCSLYGIVEINGAISAIALTLANDRIAEVRVEAVLLLVEVMRRLVHFEQSGSENMEVEMPITSVLIRDILASFAGSTKWGRRITFTQICYALLNKKAFSPEQFRHLLLAQLFAKAFDKVANIRLTSCKALSLLDHGLSPVPQGEETTLTVGEVLKKLTNDDDIDVSREARLALKDMTEDKTDLNLRARTIQDKENMFFANGNITTYDLKDMTVDTSELSSTISKDNYDVMDMEVTSEGCDDAVTEEEDPNSSEC